MSEPNKNRFSGFSRYLWIFLKQTIHNREYLYFWIFGTLIDILAAESIRPLAWLAIAMVNLLVGLMAIRRIVKPIDQAFESIGLDYSKGYGKPYWQVEGKYPVAQEIIRINSAGYGAEDYERYANLLATRIRQPIREIRKPSPSTPTVEVVLKRNHLLSLLPFGELPLRDLKPGEFFVGKTDDVFEKLSLTSMIHMLVAGQTGAGKTQFLRQFMATILSETRNSYVALIDMKGGIDFQSFMDVPNFKLVTSYDDAQILLRDVISLFEERKKLLLFKRKTNWVQMSSKELENEPSMAGKPIGPVVVVVDELAELAKKASEQSSKSPIQGQLATLARLSRFTGIHLVLGTQRPDKGTLDMQSKDNLPTRICFSVPSVTASTLVIGDMSASTLGNTPGRAIYQLSGTKVVQTPLIENAELEAMLSTHTERLSHQGYNRGFLKNLGKVIPIRGEELPL